MNMAHSLPVKKLLLSLLLASNLTFAADDKVMLNFVNADIESTIKAVGLISGRNFVIDPRVKGNINIVSSTPVHKDLVYPILLSSLRLQGFAVVESAGLVKVVPEADAKQHFSATSDKNLTVSGDRIITQVYPLKYESATQLVPILRPMVTPNNVIAAYNGANTLVITDYADNIKRLNKIIASIDQPSAADYFTINLKHSSAIDIAAAIARMVPEIGSVGMSGQPVVPATGAEGVRRSAVVADPRSNSLLVRAETSAAAQNVRRLVDLLDQPAATSGNINVVYLRNADAVKLAQTLRAVVSGQDGGNAVSSTSSPATSTTGTQAGGASFSAASSSNNTPSGGGMIQADAATNALIITAPDYVYRNLRAVIDKLDVRRAQVYVEALIVELGTDDASEFGFQWQTAEGAIDSSKYGAVGGTNFGSTGQNILGAVTNPLSMGQGLSIGVAKGTVTYMGQEILNLGVLARALESNRMGNVLSTPNLLTLDNEEAKIIVGQNVPFITGTQASTGSNPNPFQTVERKDVGITLKIKPQISEGGGITMQVYQEVSSVDENKIAGSVDLTTKKRTIESKVLVDDGQLIVLGGLIEKQVSQSTGKVPLLGDIPLLGALFKYDSRSAKKVNLMVFLKPVVMKDGAASASLSGDRYSYIRSEQQAFRLPDSVILKPAPEIVLPELQTGKPKVAAPDAIDSKQGSR